MSTPFVILVNSAQQRMRFTNGDRELERGEKRKRDAEKASLLEQVIKKDMCFALFACKIVI